MHFKFMSCVNLLFMISQIRAESCETPNNEAGECISLRECPALRQLITNKTTAVTEFVRKSICGFADLESLVCCPSLTNSNSSMEDKKKTTNKRQLLPDRRYCGYQHSDDFVHDTNSTLITEFPWLARIAYRKKEENETFYVKKYLCVGSLINQNYILTTGTCADPPQFVITEIRLGEYNTVNDTDCVSDEITVECSEPVRDFTLSKIIVHPEYNKTRNVNDIALLRLNGNVLYSDYIRPICLPLPGTSYANIGEILTTSGWGQKNLKGDKTSIKKRVLGRIIPNEECAEAFKILPSFKLIDNHLCTRVLENSTELSCAGDSGAPVIISRRLQWHQEGIVSIGVGRCGHKYPEVLTRVRNFIEWIEENIEP